MGMPAVARCHDISYSARPVLPVTQYIMSVSIIFGGGGQRGPEYVWYK